MSADCPPDSQLSKAERRRLKCLLPLSECAYCGEPLEGFPSLDHVLPRSRGGPDGMSNRAPACRRCDRRKDNRTPEELVEWALRVVEVQRTLRELAQQRTEAERQSSRKANGRKTEPRDMIPGDECTVCNQGGVVLIVA
jgi:hypothetical protein